MCSFNLKKNKVKPIDLIPEGKIITGVLVRNKEGKPILLTDFTDKEESVEILIKGILQAGAENNIICTFRGDKKDLKKVINTIINNDFSFSFQ